MFFSEILGSSTVYCAMVVIVVSLVCFALILFRDKKFKQYVYYENAFEAFQIGVIIFNSREKLVFLNDSAQAYFSTLNVDPPSSLNQFLNFLYDHASEGEDDSITKTLNLQPRQDFSFREIIEDNHGGVYLVEARKSTGNNTVFTLNDVTHTHRHEQEVLKLQRFSTKLYHAVEVATNGIAIIRLQNGGPLVVFANKSFCDIMGIERQDVFESKLDDIFSILNDSHAQDDIKQVIKAKKNSDIEISLTNAEGKRHHYSLKLSFVSKAELKNEMYIGVISDITELRQREAEFFQAQKLEALGQMAAGLAHDFNNVLSIISGYARLGAKLQEEGSVTKDYLERIEVASGRGAGLIKKMLTFSRHQIVAETVIDLSATLKEQKMLLSPLLDASIKLEIEELPEEIYVECEQGSFTQILMNLVVNARDAMADGGVLTLKITSHASDDLPDKLQQIEHREYPGIKRRFACLCVKDSGTGMYEETIERIFDPFFTTKDHGQGTGLGLSMVYGLVKQFKGYIDVHSTYGYGTEMRVYFPITDKVPNRVVTGSLGEPAAIRFEGYTALIAEDEPDLRLLITNMLQQMGMKVLAASNGAEALAMQDDYEDTIDVLITDVVMPEMDGIELAEFIEVMRPEIKIFFMSGYPAGSRHHQKNLPEDAYFMAKPIQYEALTHMIYKSLKESEASPSDIATEASSEHWINT